MATEVVVSSGILAKGVFYKIKDSEGKTRGYLFGTIHKIKDITFDRLHPKVVQKFNKSSALFVELNRLEKKLIREAIELEFPPEMLLQHQDEIDNILEEHIKLRRQNPEGVDDLFMSGAEKQGKKISSIETLELRKKTEKALFEEYKYFKFKKMGITYLWMFTAFQLLQNINPQNYDDSVVRIYELLICSIQMANYDEFMQCKQLFDLINLFAKMLPDEYSAPLKSLFLKFHAENNRSSAVDKHVYVEQLSIAEKNWIEGNIDQLALMLTQLSPLDDLTLKTAFRIRDPVTAEVIHQDLLVSTPTKKGFYAIGYIHLADGYQNVKHILMSKGWKLVSAYE